jgi:hypothetical protein
MLHQLKLLDSEQMLLMKIEPELVFRDIFIQKLLEIHMLLLFLWANTNIKYLLCRNLRCAEYFSKFVHFQNPEM